MALILLSACAQSNVIPTGLQDLVDYHVSFAQVKDALSSYRGRLIVVGGVVLSAKRLKDETRLEVLQLPLDRSLEPKGYLTESQGRFLAFQREFLDPATLPVGTAVTVVGEVTGAITLPLDEATYTYPNFEIKALTVWPKMAAPSWFHPYPYFGAYWGSYWGPYWGPPWGSHP